MTVTATLVVERTITEPAPRPTAGAIVQDLLRQRDELPADDPGRAVLRARSIDAGKNTKPFAVLRRH